MPRFLFPTKKLKTPEMSTSPVADEQEQLLDHSYDGIQEFDNPLPGWWKWTFVGSFVFSVFYLMYFHIGAPGRSIIDQYDRQSARLTMAQYGKIGDLTADEETIRQFYADESWLRVGAGLFKTKCVSCHGSKGEGNVGPNLTDDYFKNLRDLEGIARVIDRGAANGAMPAWGNRLDHPNDLVMLSAYVASLRGTQPGGNAKGPEGSEIPPWPEPLAAIPADESADTEEAGGAE